jgi:hypothetical protein
MELINKFKQDSVRNNIVKEAIEKQVFEPYFGWCDVDGCNNEGCAGGACWEKTGYWTVCSKHSALYRDGGEQPKMKIAAIRRESKRDKTTGYLPY